MSVDQPTGIIYEKPFVVLSHGRTAYIFLLLLLAPIDYFLPTAAALREGGAKPAIPLMIVGTAWIMVRHMPSFFKRLPSLWTNILLLLFGIGLAGIFAFLLNLSLGISYTDGARSPFGQFFGQGILFALVPFVLLAHAWLFSQPGVSSTLIRMLPAVVLTHLLVISAEYGGLVEPHRLPLSLFRTPDTAYGGRPTGLMTEPSYVGAMAGMYGLALIMVPGPKHNRWRKTLGIVVILLALLLGSKTLVPVLLAASVAYAWQARVRLIHFRTIMALVAIVIVSVFLITTYSALDVQENLSSAMRFGSTLLAINVAKAGYGLLGVGFGQFHFLYQPRFAPWFLFYSAEATEAFSHSANYRASTYNLFARLIVETGVLGFLLFAALIVLLFVHARSEDSNYFRFAVIIAAASLGFLMTQDAYFFPSFILGASMLASYPSSNKRRPLIA